jgi:hypothetical protein
VATENTAGLPVTSDGHLATVVDGVHSFTHNGFSFDETGRVRVTANAPVEIHNGFGFDATGALSTTTVDPGADSIHNGYRVAPNGAVFIA